MQSSGRVATRPTETGAYIALMVSWRAFGCEAPGRTGPSRGVEQSKSGVLLSLSITRGEETVATTSTDFAAQKVGTVRYGIVAMLFAVTVINYADRATIAIAGPVVSRDLGLTAVQMGFIFSAFGWSYVICQVPGGWLLDRFGSKAVYFVSIFSWSLFTLLQGAVGLLPATAAFFSLFLLRLLVGLAEAPSFPANARICAA